MTATLDAPAWTRPDRRRPRRRRWPVLLALLTVLLAVGGAGWIAFQTSVLGYRSTVVSGADPTVTQAVELAVDVPVGTPLITVDLAAVRARVLALPDVRSASVSRRWPDTLLIGVIERVPVAVTHANGALWLVDSGGLVYEQVTTAAPGLVTIEVARPGPADPATRAALAVAAAFPADFRASVGAVVATSPYHVTLRLTSGKTVDWGSADDNARKMQILPALLRQPGSAYDVSDPELVTAH